MPPRHDRQAIAEFLDADFRQVWAVDRQTSEPKFLADGQATELRSRAKAEWRCPVPGCTVEITTVGGTRRHHFRHNAPAPHPSDGESEAHLAAKAMLKSWAEAWLQRHGTAGTAVEEESVKDSATALHRIADVMVTWPVGNKTAFEVEYKTFAADAWATKQADYDTKQIACVWLLGHTKLKPLDGAGPTVAIRNSALAEAIAASGRHVLFINPMTRQVGTLCGNAQFTSKPRRDPYLSCLHGWLALDGIDDCALDPEHGLITPTMERVDEATAAREKAERLRAEQQALAVAKAKAEADLRSANWERIQQRNQTAWDTSPLRARVQERWPNKTPAILERPTPDTWGIHALPVHWHTVIYFDLIDTATVDTKFTINDCYRVLDSHSIARNWNTKKSFKALIQYLNALAKSGLVTIHRNERGNVTGITAHGRTIDDLRRAAQERQTRKEDEKRRLAALRQTTGSTRLPRALKPEPVIYTETIDVERDKRRSLCEQCGGALPAYQRGGSHIPRCPPSSRRSN